MGGGRPRASTSDRSRPKRPRRDASRRAAHLPKRHSGASRRHSCAGRNPLHHAPRTPPSPIHPSPLLGGRLGGGWEAASQHRRSLAPQAPTPAAAPRISPSVIPVSPSPSFLRRQEPRAHHSCLRRNDGIFGSAAGGRSAPPTPHLTSPLKGGRDEFSWGRYVVRVAWWLGGSCLRRNDERGGRGWRNRGLDRWCWFAASHPPPSLPPRRGEG